MATLLGAGKFKPARQTQKHIVFFFLFLKKLTVTVQIEGCVWTSKKME